MGADKRLATSVVTSGAAMGLGRFRAVVPVLLLIPVAFLLLFPSPYTIWGLAGALLLFLYRWLTLGHPIPATPLNAPLLLLLAMTGLALALSPAQDLGAVYATQLVAGVTVFFVLCDLVQSRPGLWRVAAGLTLLGLLLAIAAPFTSPLTQDKVFALPALFGHSWPQLFKESNPNIVAGALAPIVPIALVLLARADRRWRALGAITASALFIMVVLLQSRGALAALAVGLGVGASLYRRWVLPLLPLAVLAALIVNGLVGGPPAWQFLYGKAGPFSSTDSFEERVGIWAQAVYLIRASPALGIGLGAYPRIAPYTYPYSTSQPGNPEAHAHNMFLQIALDTGLLGLAAVVAILLLAIRGAWRAYRSRLERPLAMAVLASLTVIIVHGLGDTIVWGSKSSVVLWIVLSLAVGLDKITHPV